MTVSGVRGEDTQDLICNGNSALGACQAPVLYRIEQGPHQKRYVCGRHLAWQVRRMMTPGRSVTVTDLREPTP